MTPQDEEWVSTNRKMDGIAGCLLGLLLLGIGIYELIHWLFSP